MAQFSTAFAPVFSPVFAPTAVPWDATGVVAGALVHFDETTIVGSTPVTAMTNKGSGGADYSLTVSVGTAENLTTTTINGLLTVSSDGSAALETAAGQNITSPATIFIVVGDLNANGILFVDNRSGGNRWIMSNGNSSDYAMNQGTAIKLTGRNASFRLLTFQFNGDSTSKISASGLGSTTGDAGSLSYDFGTLFGTQSSASYNGEIPEFIIYPVALSDSAIASNQEFLVNKWGL